LILVKLFCMVSNIYCAALGLVIVDELEAFIDIKLAFTASVSAGY
jgi:hypothetical protein